MQFYWPCYPKSSLYTSNIKIKIQIKYWHGCLRMYLIGHSMFTLMIHCLAPWRIGVRPLDISSYINDNSQQCSQNELQTHKQLRSYNFYGNDYSKLDQSCLKQRQEVCSCIIRSQKSLKTQQSIMRQWSKIHEMHMFINLAPANFVFPVTIPPVTFLN